MVFVSPPEYTIYDQSKERTYEKSLEEMPTEQMMMLTFNNNGYYPGSSYDIGYALRIASREGTIVLDN